VASEGSVDADAAGLEAAHAADEGATTVAGASEPPTVRNPEPLYAWLITDGLAAGETATKLGRLGPIGASRRFSVSKVLTAGVEFRLMDRDGAVRFGGRIAGQYEGVEPVVDFGIDHDCFIIEYRRGEEWVRVRASA
jgi:hypothetical protein